MSGDEVMCRFRYEKIKVDVMSTKSVGWAPANPWFEPGFKHLITFQEEDADIKCLSLPYYLANKFAAFYSRGHDKTRMSHDFEDIVYLLNYTSDFPEKIKQANQDVQSYLNNCFWVILADH